MVIPNTFSLVSAVIFLLFFGLLFNWVTATAERKGYAEGYTWLFVAVGTAVILGVGGLLAGWKIFLLFFVLFAAAGTPMAAGEIWRFWQARKREQERLSK